MADSKRSRKKPKPKTFIKPQVTAPPQIDPESNLESELLWCVQKLRNGLAENKDAKKAAHASKVLAVLQNPQAPLVKKRQMMRITFGDYRKKMQDDENKYAAAAKKIKLQTPEQKHLDQCTFYKKSASSDNKLIQTSNDIAKACCDDTGTVSEPSNSASGQPFKFDFTTDTVKDSDATTSQDNQCKTSDLSESVSSLTIKDDKIKTQQNVNFFKMERTGSAFSFNFPEPES